MNGLQYRCPACSCGAHGVLAGGDRGRRGAGGVRLRHARQARRGRNRRRSLARARACIERNLGQRRRPVGPNADARRPAAQPRRPAGVLRGRSNVCAVPTRSTSTTRLTSQDRSPKDLLDDRLQERRRRQPQVERARHGRQPIGGASEPSRRASQTTPGHGAAGSTSPCPRRSFLGTLATRLPNLSSAEGVRVRRGVLRAGRGGHAARGVEQGGVVHPPGGKWLIAAGIRSSGSPHSVGGSRPSVSGCLVVLLTYYARAKSCAATLPALAAGAVALDGVSFTTGRVAMLDVFLALFTTVGHHLHAVALRDPTNERRVTGADGAPRSHRARADGEVERRVPPHRRVAGVPVDAHAKQSEGTPAGTRGADDDPTVRLGARRGLRARVRAVDRERRQDVRSTSSTASRTTTARSL